ncbi:hypothetical protein [Rarobacter incanus]|uniref:Uncharacterized protein n=1 Tax=Rarobacter incanus TaxID=153494 RepID=A0A542SRT7_9MICO|nr:hypothetical protein [Rarobacter incanus]TQK77331.1 hypothetical protein FB389_2058 [Rarobacter incanus]
MSRQYEKQTDRRSREERHLSVRAVHREQPDLTLLTELMIRFALQDLGERRVAESGPKIFDTSLEGKA